MEVYGTFTQETVCEENMLGNILITSNINAKELVLDIFDNKISSDNFKQKLINNTLGDPSRARRFIIFIKCLSTKIH